MDTASESTTSDAPTESIASGPERCHNCGAALDGPYCSTCGQRHLDRLRFAYFRRKIVDLLFDVEHGLLHTLRLAARNPGRLARRYVEGERKSFVGPVAFFLLTTTGMYLVYFVFKAEYVQFMLDMQTAMWAEMGTDPETLFGPDTPFSVFGIESLDDYAGFVFDLQQYLQTYVGLFVAVPAALLQRHLIGGWSTIEAGVFELYTLAQGNLIAAVVAPICFLTYTPALMAVGLVIQVALHAYAAGAFYDRTLRARVLVPLSYLAGMLAFVVLSMVLGFLFGFGYEVYTGGL